MNRIKKIIKFFFFPHVAIVLLVDILSAPAFLYSLFKFPLFHHITIISFVFFVYAVLLTLCALPEIVLRLTGKKLRTEYLHRLASDTQLQINISLYGTLAYNTLYATFQLFTGLYYNSIWYLSIAAYYILLAVMRFSLLHYSRSHKAGEDIESELKRFRFCGILLLVMSSALSAITFYITWQNQELKHHSATTIVFAIFTCVSFTISIINVIKYKKQKSPLLFATKLISFVATIVSILALETALIGRFSAQIPDNLRQLITGATGLAVLVITGYIGIFMVVRGSKRLKEFKEGKLKTPLDADAPSNQK